MRSCACVCAHLCLILCDLKDGSPPGFLSMGFPRQEYWSGLPVPPPGNLSELETEPASPALQVGSLPLSHKGSPQKKWFSSVSQLCPTLCSSMDCSTPGFPVLHHLPELTQTYVHRVGDAIHPSHSLSSPSPPAFNLSQRQHLFQ